MKKVALYCIVLCLVFSSIRAVDVPLTTLLELRTAVLDQMAHATAGTALLSAAIVNEAINRAQLKVAYDFPAFEKLDTISLTASATPSQLLNEDFIKLNWAMKVLGDTIMAIEYVPPQTLYGRQGGRVPNISDNTQFSFPRYCYVSRALTAAHKPSIWFYPQDKVTGAPMVYVSYYAIPEELSSDTDSTDIAPEYREALLYWACSALAFQIGKSNLGMTYLNVYKEILALSKASEIRQPFERGFPASAFTE